MPRRGRGAQAGRLAVRLAVVLLACALSLAAVAARGQPLDAVAAAPTTAFAGRHYAIVVDAPAQLHDALVGRTLLGRWRDDPDYDPEQLPLFVARAVDEGMAIARAAGFFGARVTASRLADGDGGRPVVRIAVDAGVRTRVVERIVSVDGDDDSALARGELRREVLERWPLEPGEPFVTEVWEQAKRQAVDQLQQRGYLRARLAGSRAEVDAQAATARLLVALDTGPRLAYGALVVRGLQRYDRRVVENLAGFSPGQPYAFDALLRFQARLRASGWFEAASVLPDLQALEADPQLGRVPVIVEVSERRTFRVTAGVGVSTDQGPRGLLGFEHRDLFGWSWQLEAGLLAEPARQRAFATVRTPFDASGHRFETGLRAETADIQRERVVRDTVWAGRVRRRDDLETFASLQFQTEARRVDTAAMVEESRRRALTLGYAWNLRRVDALADPREGHTITVQVSGAWRGLLSDQSFGRLYTRALRFVPMARDGWLAGGLLVGSVELGQVVADSRDAIPSENLFRAGGAQSLRGYRFQSLGVAEGAARVGGRALAIGSLEYQHPVGEGLAAAAFVDAGNVADRWSDWKMVRGWGTGVRWRSPVGPVNVDLAWGEATRRWQLHFSIGWAF